MMDNLLLQIKNCKICEDYLPLGCNPVLTAHPDSRIVIVGQAPGIKVHQSGIPWDDQSGDNLRRWLNVSKTQFYDTNLFAIIPMGFCYPGKGKSGDLPPRKECAPQWHGPLFRYIKDVKLVLLVGLYAQKYYLGDKAGKNLTETVRNYDRYLPQYFPLPHSSPINNRWQKKNSWFNEEVLPTLRERIALILNE